ncbi:hypothetical protein U1Q18_013076 [Sarracenia purpurea var. burkii]
MFNKIIKRGHRKLSKSEANDFGYFPPGNRNSGFVSTSNIYINHASRGSPAPPAVTDSGGAPPSGTMESLPIFREVPVAERQNLFRKKLQICCFQFDFADTLKMVREKEIKRQTLGELVDFIQSGSGKVTENEDVPYLDPSWPHLQLVYELLLRYVVSPNTDTKIAKKFIDHSFVLKLLDLFDSEDPREREYLKTILHRIYGSGIGEILEILGSIINGFALPMKEEHKLFLVRALIPLHKPKPLAFYHQQLIYCIIQFVEKDYKLADNVVRGLLKYWPVTNCQKEVLFLGELEEVLETTQAAEFQRCMVPLFRQIACCLNSSHFQVAERALFLWNNEHIVNLIAQNRRVILPIIFEALEKNIQSHWNQAVHGLTVNVRKMFLEMDAELFEECQSRYAEKEARVRELDKRRESTWQRLAAAAAQEG